MKRPQIALLLLVPVLSGCIYSQEIAHLRRDIEKAADADFDREFVLVVGPGTFRTIGWLARHTPDDHARLAGDYVSDVRRVKVGVYSVVDSPDRRTISMDRVPRLRDGGWEVAVRVDDESESVWVLFRERYGAIRDVLVVALDDEQLIIVRLQGFLDRMVERAVADREFIRDMTDW